MTRGLHLDPDHENEPTQPRRTLVSARAERLTQYWAVAVMVTLFGLLVAVGTLVKRTIELAPIVRTASTGCATVCAAPCDPCPPCGGGK